MLGFEFGKAFACGAGALISSASHQGVIEVLRRGMDLESSGEYEKAVELYNEATRMNASSEIAPDANIDAAALYLRAGVSSKIEGHESAAGPLFEVVLQMLGSSGDENAHLLAAQDDALERACAAYLGSSSAPDEARRCLHQRIDLAQGSAQEDVPMFILECLQRQVERIDAEIGRQIAALA